jgi:hypothetical protein
MLNLENAIVYSRKVLYSVFFRLSEVKMEKKTETDGLEKRWKNGQIIDDDICSCAADFSLLNLPKGKV